MPSAPPPPPPSSPSSSEPVENDLLQRTHSGLLRACDIVFGTIAVALAVLGIWLFAAGEIRLLTLVALWSFPVFNSGWSALTRRRDRVIADLTRCAVSLPIALYLYVAEAGMLEKLWVPALMMPVGTALSVGIATRRGLFGYLASFVYAVGLQGASVVSHGRFDVDSFDDSLGILLTGCIISMMAARLGHTLEEARRQRDSARAQTDRAEVTLQQLTERSQELTTAIRSLHDEMEHRMRVEIELRQAQKLESVGRLAAGVAHEINTPVQFVTDSIQFVRSGVAEVFDVVDKLEVVQRSVLEGAPSRDAAARAADVRDSADLAYLAENVPIALDRALAGLDRVATIVRSMRVFAHPDSAEMGDADLNQAIESTLTIAHNEYRYVADLETDLGDLPPVRCYIGELNQAILNIVVNAAHAIEDVVAGAGIPEGARDHIFDPFFTTKKVGRGTGQGLAIARSVVVDKHRGTLAFETELGKGTTFNIRLPIEGVRAASPVCAA
ncbi:MAG: hypothetical protein E6J91_17485 [Deltaproteobacteria bacterium]|nr:MAG: hypothetical protein E6J91_17485 [Deltaproteobacteria bacterium]